MKKLISVSLIILAILSCNGRVNSGESVTAKLDISILEPKIDELVKKYQDIDIFSGVVLIAENGKPLYHKAFGLANREKNIPNTLNTRFDIGSMNKSFTKIVTLQLVNEGKLSLDDKLGKFVNGFSKEAAENITINHLLTHRSGLGDYNTPEYWDMPFNERSLQTYLKLIQNLPLQFQPGTDEDYSNAGYLLLGLIIENVTGKSYYDVVEERIVDRLNLKDTFLRDKYTVPNRAIGYFKNIKGELQNNDSFHEIPTPDGGFYSTTSDMFKFYRAFHYGEKLWNESAKSLDENYSSYKNSINTGGVVMHAGGFEGENTVHYENLRDKISVIVFANMDEIVAENLGSGILTIIRGKSPQNPNLPAEQAVYQAYIQKGVEYIKKNWDDLTTNFHPEDPKDFILNQIGYEFLFDGKKDDAIRIFKLNTQLFPDIANCWDSYGEALLKSGNESSALNAYKKALTINPNMPSAKEAVKQLTEN